MKVRPAPPDQTTITLGRTRWLVITVLETAFAAAIVVAAVLFERAAFASSSTVWSWAPLWAPVGGLLLVTAACNQVLNRGYEIVIRGETVRIRSLVRSWEFPLSALVGVSGPQRGRYGWTPDFLTDLFDRLIGRIEGRTWALQFEVGSGPQKVKVVSRQDLAATPLAATLRRPLPPVVHQRQDGSTPEGWCTDPFGRHEARWMSQGTPTDLVRDGGVEGRDRAPDEPFTTAPQRIEATAAGDGAHLARADDAQRHAPFDPVRAVRAGQDAVNRTSGSY